MTPGIFSNWDWSELLKKPETAFKKQLQKNPVHPFREIVPNVFVYQVQSGKYGVGIILLTLLALGTIAFYPVVRVLGVENDYLELLIFPLLLLIGFGIKTHRLRSLRTYILDTNEKMYEFYKGKKLVYRGHFHNVYIRLKGQNAGGGVIYYSVSLDGYMLDEVAITGITTKQRKLTKLAKRLAHRLDLNFFDWRDKGHWHTIRHRCPYRNTSV